MKNDINQVEKMIQIIRKIQESTKDSPVIQSEIRKIIQSMGEKMKDTHLTLTESMIKVIETDSSLADTQKKEMIKTLNEEKVKVMGLF